MFRLERFYSQVWLKFTYVDIPTSDPIDEGQPAVPTSPADEEPPSLPPTALEVVIPLIRDLEKAQLVMKKWFLRQYT